MPRLAVLAALLLACGDPVAAPDAGAPDAGPLIQGSPATGDLVVNEVFSRGAGPDWIELLNRSSATLDLCDYFVTDSIDRLDHYLPLGGVAPPDPCSPRLLGPGEYLVVYADGNPGAGLDHAPFKLGAADEAHVVSATGLPIDTFVYLHPDTAVGQSLARQPDGDGLFHLAAPSPGASNPEPAP
ncbi:MAG TPA: lamin tail domain-containing protein [Kofleriaceae bacterium]|nr:lamin tail domain-containing protein [Kofleriaceae bacterium]